jgi:hypothetical protein
LDIQFGDTLREFLLLTNAVRPLAMLDRIRELVRQDPTLDMRSFFHKEGRHLGQLSFKEEAAGKLRVFAMVDVFTQSILKPLHDYLFNLFRNLPNDGTHNQERAFELAMELAKKYNGSYGFDLSSATDRLPVVIQSYFLSILFGKRFGEL